MLWLFILFTRFYRIHFCMRICVNLIIFLWACKQAHIVFTQHGPQQICFTMVVFLYAALQALPVAVHAWQCLQHVHHHVVLAHRSRRQAWGPEWAWACLASRTIQIREFSKGKPLHGRRYDRNRRATVQSVRINAMPAAGRVAAQEKPRRPKQKKDLDSWT